MYFFSTISHSPSTFPFLWFLICTSVKGFAIAGSLTVNHGSQQLCLHVACIREASWPSVAAACLSLAVAIGEGVWGNWKYSQTFSPERKLLTVFSSLCWNLFPHGRTATQFCLCIPPEVRVGGLGVGKPTEALLEAAQRGSRWPCPAGCCCLGREIQSLW